MQNGFKPYRFSPIMSESALYDAIDHIHASCYRLLRNSLGIELSNAGNIGIFCHYDDEFEYLKGLRDELCEPSDDPQLKYFTLKQPIVVNIPGSPAATYTHLYIRRPDPYRSHVGDIDFSIPSPDYKALTERLRNGENIPGARQFERPDLDMIELFHPDIDALAYISTSAMTEKVRIKLSDATKL